MKQNNEDINKKRELIKQIREAEEKKKRGKKFLNTFLMVLIAVMIVGLIGVFLDKYQNYNETPIYNNPLNLSNDEISCLALNYKFYGTSTCPHCNNQKSYFGKDVVDVTYISCEENSVLCQKLGITGVPYHYIINSETGNHTILMGEQTIDKIFEASQCQDKYVSTNLTK